MVQYSLPQSPEITLTVPGKDSAKAREKAMEQLMELMESGELPTDLADGFGPQQFIELKEPGTLVIGSEDALNQAVQILSGLATLKLKAQESRAEAMEVRQQIDILFSNDPISEAEITLLKDGFKVLKTYAQANLRYRDARGQAEDARAVLDEALRSPDLAVPTPAEPDDESDDEPEDEPAPKAPPTAKPAPKRK
jgi:hypothetical protein